MELNGAELGLIWAVPFAGLLLSIALMPLLTQSLWHHHYGKITLLWALALLIPMAVIYGAEIARVELFHSLLIDFMPFIVLVFALYTVSGGVLLDGDIDGTPVVNTAFLAGGTLLAGVAGTTGASILLIRPLLRANAHRRFNIHVVIFFIFLVSNMGGALSPLGPPLYLGFLAGVDFFWPTLNLWRETAVISGCLLVAFFVIDVVAGGGRAPRTAARAPIKLRGVLNIFLLGAIIAVILVTSAWKDSGEVDLWGAHLAFSSIVLNIALIGIAATSLLLTPVSLRERNAFTWNPILEVAKLFAGIFVTMAPVMAMLQAGKAGAFAPAVAMITDPEGRPINAMYFWITGGLSSVLDNAPTYLVFFNAAGGDPQRLMYELPLTLAAISTGAAFMGANTYIGNAPNFMVKAMAEEAGVKMPSFFGFMLWSAVLLVPCYVLLTYLFFR